MQRYARLSTAVIFGVMTLLVTAVPFFFYKLPSGILKLSDSDVLLWTKLPPALISGALWPSVLVAALLGAALGGLFAKTTSMRLGIFYAACLGVLISSPLPHIVALSQLRINNYVFALTFTAFDKPLAAVPGAVGILSENSAGSVTGSLLVWLPGPLAGVLVWAWLRYQADDT